MKTKIAVIAMLAISFGVKAQWNSTGNNLTTGSVTIQGGSVGEHFKRRFNYNGGGWARDLIEFENSLMSSGSFRVGSYGGSTDYVYTYLGYGNYGDIKNLRIYPNGNTTFGGDVGIGTTSPEAKLHIRKANTGQTSFLRLTNSNGAINDTADIDFSVTSAVNIPTARISAIRMATGALTDLTFSSYNAGLKERMRIDSNGNVGIGTTSPSVRLDISDNKEDYVSVIENSGVGNAKSTLWLKTKSTWTSSIPLKITKGTDDKAIFQVGANQIRIGEGTINQSDETFLLQGNFRLGNGGTYDDLVFKTGSAFSGTNGVFEIAPKTVPGSGIAKQTTYFKNAEHSSGKTIHNVVVDGKVGIGTNSPSEKLEIVDSNASLRIRSTNSANNSSLKLDWGINHGYHISYNPNTAVTYFDSKHNAISNTPYGDVLFRRNVDNVMKETFVIKGNSGHVGIGTVDPGAWKLAVNGNIRAKEIKVETGWSDFVFYDDYKLPTLEEVENHIKEKGHLKDIPSAKEVADNGIFLGEMDSKLLQKIEELTLYTIEQEKKIKALEKQVQENKKQNSKIKELEVLVQKLLKEKN
ncbi:MULTISPECIES: hypothetical protein [unclassified Tenacibaculum]|uniref:hypothetical protein n=1 Tax=unclassified Tenacibaculum TaxID=2635139 RepID=UPI001F1E923C|nr:MULTISPECIES: hypothetical protein [unclassified Tenacibaculum]MCF2873363.1 hypothetical protein [Tenacibaculum sp. Cn5-1]MCF2933519.1 hypothetical protein [Tenacibaculum sp. Cn5-34]MCG7509899.1 hypothetical protein [Tenacibaculum sp. Cn5-46]